MPPASSPQDSRTRILRSTLELIGQRGVTHVTNRNIARAAGISLGSLTYHFSSQVALLREALELFIAEETERLGQLTKSLEASELTSDQAAQALEALLAQHPARRLAKLELYLQASRNPDLRDVALRCFAAYDQLATSALGALGVVDADRVAPLVVALIDGLQLRRLASGEPELRVAQPLTTLLRGLGRAAQS